MKRLIHKFIINLRHNGLGMTAMKTKDYLISSLGRLRPAFGSKYQDESVPQKDISETNRTVTKWNESDTVYQKKGFKEYWELLEDVQRHEALLMAQGKDIIEYICSFFPKDKKLSDMVGLIIGCTHGDESPTVAIARTGAFRTLIVVDVAEGLLRRQEQITDDLGLNHILRYKRLDLNVDSLPDENGYDLVFANGTIHHIRELESLFANLNKSLHEDGLFVMKEYVGPSYLQFTDRQVRLVNRILDCLPDYLKKQNNGIIKREAFRPTMAEVISDDPSEAVRSQDILRIVKNTLEVLTCNPTGGTLLHLLLHAIAGNFEKGDSERAVLKSIILMEQLLIEEGVIPSDYVFLIAKKKVMAIGDVFQAQKSQGKELGIHSQKDALKQRAIVETGIASAATAICRYWCIHACYEQRA